MYSRSNSSRGRTSSAIVDETSRQPLVAVPSGSSPAPLLRVAGISKSYGQARAIGDAHFTVQAGEVMALLGENGAGKSTIVKCLAGLVQPDAGEIEIAGKAIALSTPADSLAAGIAVVQQELSLVATLTAAENVFLGTNLPGAWTQRRLQRLAKPHLDLVGLPESHRNRPIAELSVAERQLIEIARLIARDARILIFDEPTAALSDVEIERVLEVVRRLAATGCAVIYVTHRLREVFMLADRATIMRGGYSQPTVDIQSTDLSQVVAMMLGQTLENVFPERLEEVDTSLPPVFELRELTTSQLVTPVNLSIAPGQIVGLVGQIGSGAPSILQAIAGIDHTARGEVYMMGRRSSPRSIRQAIAQGIAYCSADRKRDGFFYSFSVTQNFMAPTLRSVSVGGWYSAARARRHAEKLADMFSVSRDRLTSAVGTLSGGNQQKVVLGKWMSRKSRVLLVEEPTRGVDIGARSEIYRQLRLLANSGVTVIFASSDISEAVGLADTLLTFYRGALVRARPAIGLDEAEVMIDVTHGTQERAA